MFSLSVKYAPFLGLLTFGIMPESVWAQVSAGSASLAEFNLKPIGSGPYEFKSLAKDRSGEIKSYVLSANKNYYGAKSYLKEVVFKFYADIAEAVAALNSNNIDAMFSLTKEDTAGLVTKNSLNFFKLSQPRLKAVFLNSEKNASLKDVKVRQALSFATPRQAIIDQAAGGDAKPVYGPIMENNFAYNAETEKYDFDLARAASLLDSAGWKKEIVTAEDLSAFQERRDRATSSKEVLSDEEKNKIELGVGEWLYREPAPAKTAAKTAVKTTASKTVAAPVPKTFLKVSLTIIDSEEDSEIAELILKNWEKIGVKTSLKKISVREIQTSAIKPKNYEALLFSQMVGADPDAYAFWDSTQAVPGGLNLSNYKNEEVDKLLEEGRLTSNRDERLADYRKFQELLANDAPAIFLFSRYHTYAQNKKVKGFAVKSLVAPADRFTNISNWYLKTGQRFEW
jgi:peptide/nickel transport system substrate-binding protein